jgi:hypothetical protein
MPDQQKRAIAVDFDGTLARHDGWKGADHLGEPIPEMVEKVKQALAEGAEVLIFTARANPGASHQQALDSTKSIVAITEWCQKNLGQVLPVSCVKSLHLTEIWDDRAKGVIPNTGVFVEELMGALK